MDRLYKEQEEGCTFLPLLDLCFGATGEIVGDWSSWEPGGSQKVYTESTRAINE